MGDEDAALGQQQLDIPEAQAEYVVEPHGVTDEVRRETMTMMGFGTLFMPPSSPRPW